MLFTDEKTKLRKVYLLKSKGETPQKLADYCVEMARLAGGEKSRPAE